MYIPRVRPSPLYLYFHVTAFCFGSAIGWRTRTRRTSSRVASTQTRRSCLAISTTSSTCTRLCSRSRSESPTKWLALLLAQRCLVQRALSVWTFMMLLTVVVAESHADFGRSSPSVSPNCTPDVHILKYVLYDCMYCMIACTV